MTSKSILHILENFSFCSWGDRRGLTHLHFLFTTTTRHLRNNSIYCLLSLVAILSARKRLQLRDPSRIDRCLLSSTVSFGLSPFSPPSTILDLDFRIVLLLWLQVCSLTSEALEQSLLTFGQTLRVSFLSLVMAIPDQLLISVSLLSSTMISTTSSQHAKVSLTTSVKTPLIHQR